MDSISPLCETLEEQDLQEETSPDGKITTFTDKSEFLF
jgi:hypothetical protein